METDKSWKPKLTPEQIELLFGEDIREVQKILNGLKPRKLLPEKIVELRN